MFSRITSHPLSSGSFRCFWLSQLISLFGDSLTGIAITWVLMGLTNSTLSRGVMLALSTLPTLLLTPVIGTLIDRFSRKRMLVISDACRLAVDLALICVLLTESISTWHIYAFSLLNALARVVYAPCLLAFLPTLVRREQLQQANSAHDLATRTAMMLGPVAGGIALTRLGPVAVVVIDAATFLISALFLSRIQADESVLSTRKRTSMRQQLGAGWSYVRRNRWILYQTSSMLLLNVANAIWSVVLPFVVRNRLHVGPTEHGFLTSVGSLASVAASVVLATLALKMNRKRVLVMSLVATGLFSFGMSQVNQFSLALIMMAGWGLTRPPIAIANNSIYQAAIPAEYMGRVAVFRNLITQSLMPATFLITGAIGDTIPYATSLLAAAALPLLAAVLIHLRVHLCEPSAQVDDMA